MKPVEIHESGAISFNGPEGVALFRLITLRSALRLQARTGMKMCRVSAVACAKRLGFKGRTAAQLLADLEAKHPELSQGGRAVEVVEAFNEVLPGRTF